MAGHALHAGAHHNVAGTVSGISARHGAFEIPPSPHIVSRVAARALGAGGLAGGDYVTRARAILLREYLSHSGFVLLRHESKRMCANGETGTLSVHGSTDSQYSVNCLLMQERDEARVAGKHESIAAQRTAAAQQDEELQSQAMTPLCIHDQLKLSLGKYVEAVIDYIKRRDVIFALSNIPRYDTVRKFS